MRPSIIPIESLLQDSLALDAAATRTGIDRNVARELLAELASLPMDQIGRMVLAAYEHRVRASNRRERTGR